MPLTDKELQVLRMLVAEAQKKREEGWMVAKCNFTGEQR